VNKFFGEVLSYYDSCEWDCEIKSQDKDGYFVMVGKGEESYLSYIYDSSKNIDFKTSKDKIIALESHKDTTKNTILFSSVFIGNTKDLESFSTSLVDNNEIKYLIERKDTNPNYRHIQLQSHNALAFKSYKENKHNRSAIIQATGTGKSYLIAKIAEYHYPKKIGVLSSSSFILQQQESLIGMSDNVGYMTYNMGSIDYDNEHFVVDLDVLILDEFHRAGAETWSDGVENIIVSNENLEVVGLSATHIRYLDNQRNMADELFDGNIVSHIPLVESIAKKILPMPKYVSGIYDIDGVITSYKEKLNNSQLASNEIAKGIDTLYGLTMDWDKFSNASTILSDNIENYDGKYIVFCENIEHMKLMKKNMKIWVSEAHKMKYGKPLEGGVNTYEIQSERTDAQNNITLNAFDDLRSGNGFNLLFTVNMLNEGKHIKDINGAFLLRRTMSPILFFQQIGRAFAASDEGNPLIIDMVGNVNTIHKNIFSQDLSEKISDENIRRDLFGLNSIEMGGKIIDYNVDVVDKLEEIDLMLSGAILTFKEQYSLLKAYYDQYGHTTITGAEDFNGTNIKNILNSVKLKFTSDKLGEEEINLLKAIDFKFPAPALSKDEHIQNKMNTIKEYYNEFGHVDMRVNGEYKGIKLNSIIRPIRSLFSDNSLEQKYIDELREMGFVFDVRKELEIKNAKLIESYHKEKGHTDIKFSEIYNDVNISEAATRLREKYESNKLLKESKEILNAIGFDFSPQKRKRSFSEKLVILNAYFIKNGHTKIVKDEEFNGINLTSIVATIRSAYKNNTLSQDKIDKLNSIDFVFNADKRVSFDDQYKLLVEYFNENGHTNLKNIELYKGEKLGFFVAFTRNKMQEGKLTNEQIAKLDAVNFTYSRDRFSDADKIKMLKEYVNEHGHCNVPVLEEYKEKPIGRYVQRFKRNFRDDKLNIVLTKELIDIGFDFGKSKIKMPDKIKLLEKYFVEHGHTNISAIEKYKDQNIGYIAQGLRKQSKAGKLSEALIHSLEKINFPFTIDVSNNQWKKKVSGALSNKDKDLKAVDAVVNYLKKHRTLSGFKNSDSENFEQFKSVVVRYKNNSSDLSTDVIKIAKEIIEDNKNESALAM
jgi:superfamily II DNA or RNA helicase